MSRNDQVTRQWHLLRQLESPTGVTLQQLAERLSEDYPKHLRTLRRDLSALEAAGFPLITERVRGHTHWKLLDGYRSVPALAFSATELMALMFSRDLLKPLEGTQLQASLDSAMSKAAAVLPAAGLAYVRRLHDLFSVGLGAYKPYRQHRGTIDLLTQAIDKRRTVQMRYFSASRNITTRREVDPYHLRYTAGALYLIAYCHWRRDVRLFAVERIRSLSVTDHPYQMPLGFDADAYAQDALVVMQGRRIDVELLFDKATAAWMKDKTWHASQRVTPLRDGRARMALQVADNRELIGWILSFGSGVRVVRPKSLKLLLREEARKILRQM